METPIIAFIKYVLRNEYATRTDVLCNVSTHIDRLHTECLIHHETRCEYMANLNNIVKNINSTYNACYRKVKKINIRDCLDEEFEEVEKVIYDNDSAILNLMYEEYKFKTKKRIDFESFCSDVYEDKKYLSCIGGIDRYAQLLYEDMKDSIQIIKTTTGYPFIQKLLGTISFEQIDSKISSLVKKTGFANISDSLKHFLDNGYREKLYCEEYSGKLSGYLLSFDKHNINSFNHKKLESYVQKSFAALDVLEKLFVPVKTIIRKGDKQKGLIIEKKNVVEEINENDPNFKYSVMLDNCYKVTIKLDDPNIAIINVGYFMRDPIEVLLKTSKVSLTLCKNYFIDVKIHIFQQYIRDNIQNVDIEFKKNYLKNLRLGDVLTCNVKKLEKMIVSDYKNVYVRCINTNFKSTMELFLKEGLRKKM